MRLRHRTSLVLQERLEALLPDAVSTAWDAKASVVMVEAVSFRPASGFKGDWLSRASFEGIVRAELRFDAVDDLGAELLIGSLLCQPMHLLLPDPAQLAPPENLPGAHHFHARLTLDDLRDAVRDQMVVSVLRFSVAGTLCEYSPDPGRPTALLPGGVEPNLIEGGKA